jgi:formate/nitrite transporter FocA (FNT family)
MTAGFKQADITFIKTAVDTTIAADALPSVRTVPDYKLSTMRGIGLGAIAGLIVGILQLLYIDSPALMTWPRMSSLLFWESFGWALFGFIVGGSGVFADRPE